MEQQFYLKHRGTHTNTHARTQILYYYFSLMAVWIERKLSKTLMLYTLTKFMKGSLHYSIFYVYITPTLDVVTKRMSKLQTSFVLFLTPGDIQKISICLLILNDFSNIFFKWASIGKYNAQGYLLQG